MTKNNKSPRRSRAEIARNAAMGPNRVHGEMPPKPMVKDRAIKHRTPAPERTRSHTSIDRQPNYKLRRAIAAGTGLLAITATAAGMGRIAEGLNDERPTPTTIVEAESGDTIWELQRAEATGSGVHPDVDIRKEIDKAVELNGGTEIKPGHPVVLVEMPNQPGSPQADAEMRQQMAEGAQVATNEQMINTQLRPNDIP
jgi:hypothetical protein